MTTYAPPLPSRRLLPSAPVVVPPSYLGYRTPFCLTNPTLATRRSDDFSGRDSNLPRLVSTSRYAFSFLRTDDNGPREEEQISLAFNPLRCAPRSVKHLSSNVATVRLSHDVGEPR